MRKFKLIALFLVITFPVVLLCTFVRLPEMLPIAVGVGVGFNLERIAEKLGVL